MIDRNKFKKGLQERVKESYTMKDSSGRFKSIFLDDQNISPWNPGKGEHELNTIPYLVGPNDPRVVLGKLKVGDPAYVLDLFVHRGIGVTEDSYLCPARTYKNPCPLCEWIKELRTADDFDEDEIKKMEAKRRVIYNIWVVSDPKEEKKGVQILEIAHWFFEMNLMGIAKRPREGGYVDFADPDEGKIIYFERTGVGAGNTNYKAFQFIDRKEPIPDDILDQAKCLDSLIYIPTYEELKRVCNPEVQELSENNPENYEEPKDDRIFTEKDDEPRVETPPWEEKKKRCLEGGVFGKSFLEFEACSDCGSYRLCEYEFKENKKSEAKVTPGSRRGK